MSDVIMPKHGDAMQEGSVGTWLRRTGDFVTINDEIVQIEVDPAGRPSHLETVTVEAEETGVLHI